MSLKVWLPLNGNAQNLGTSGELTVSSNVAFTDGGKTGSKYLSAGTVTIPSSISKEIFNKTGMSFAFWLYPIGTSGSATIMGQSSMAVGNNRMYTIFQYPTPNDLHLSWQDETSSSAFLGGAWTGFFPADTWTHCCVTYDGKKASIYKNGTLFTTMSGISNRGNFEYDFPISSNSMRKINDVRIYDEVISPELIRHLSRQPHEKELKVWLPLNGDLRNQGTADVTVTSSGSATVNTNGKMGKCYSFGTSGGRLELSTDAIKTCTGDVSFALWVKFLTWNTNYATIFDVQDGSISWNNEIFAFQRNGSSSGCCFTVSNGNTGSGNYTANSCRTGDLNLNQWYHFVCVYKTGKIQIWQDGILVSEYSTSVVPNISKIQNFIIGSANTSNSYQSNILLNDFRLYSYALSPEEIKKISQGLVLHYRLSGIGGENLLPHSNVSTSDMNAMWSVGSNTMEVVTEDDITCYHFKTTASSNGINTGKVRSVYLQPNTTYTFSYWIKSSVASSFNFGKIGHFQVYNSNSTATDKAHEDVVSQRHYSTPTLTANKWTKVWVTFTTNDMTGSDFILYIWYLEPNADYWAYGFKLEKGYAATSWQPNSADSTYSLMGLDDDIEYDISGFNNNGTKSSVVITNTDSPRYATSYGTSSNSYFVNGGKISNILCQETPEYTVNLWCYKDDWTTGASELFSCAEGGGFAMDTTTSGFRAWSNVYTNADKTSYGYISYSQTHAISSGWHMFTLVDDLTGTKVYIDGVLIRTAASTNYGLHLNVNANLYIGAESSGSTYTSPYLNGRASDFRIYATALSASDVQALYNLGEV